MIFETAEESIEVGNISETLKWGQPSYLTSEPKSGTTIRLDQIKSDDGKFALYLHCQTSLIESYREIFQNKLKFEDNRAIIFDISEEIPEEELKICISMAQRYHLDK